MKPARDLYQTIRIKKDHTVRLPSVQYINDLKKAGKLSQRSDIHNLAIEFGKGSTGLLLGFNFGLLKGAYDTVTGLVKLIYQLFTGELYAMFKKLLSMSWEEVTQLFGGLFDSFEKKWNHPNPYDRWFFRGEVLGQIVFEIALAVLSAGGGLVKNLSRIEKLVPIINKFQSLKKVVITAAKSKLGKAEQAILEKKGIFGFFAWLRKRKVKKLLPEFKARLTNRLQNTPNFTLRHTDDELLNILMKGKELKLADDVIDDLLFISCRDAKPLDANEVVKQMDNWVNVVQKHGLPYKFKNKQDFEIFKKDLKQELNNIGVSTSDVRIQGSSLRTPNANDVDLVVFIDKQAFAQHLKTAFGQIKNNATGQTINLQNKSFKELQELAQDIYKNGANYSSRDDKFRYALQKGKISSKTRQPYIISGLRNARKSIAKKYPHLNVEDISVMFKGGDLDVKPYIKL